MELLQRIKQGEDFALGILLEKYRRYSWTIARSMIDEYPNYGYLLDDLMSISFAMVFTCLKTFNYQQNSFYMYWKIASRNEMVRYLKKNTNASDDGFYKELSLDNQTEEGGSLHDYIGKEDEEMETRNIYNSIIYIINKKENHFTKDEVSTIVLFLGGKDMKQISELLDISLAKTYQTFKNAVLKIRKVIGVNK